MKRLLPLLAITLAACATGDRPPVGPVEVIQYVASSHDPFWSVAIGQDQLLLTAGPSGGRADGELISTSYPPPAAGIYSGVKRWTSGAGRDAIAVEARPGPCTTGGRRYMDKVTITLSGRKMQGCGGREL